MFEITRRLGYPLLNYLYHLVTNHLVGSSCRRLEIPLGRRCWLVQSHCRSCRRCSRCCSSRTCRPYLQSKLAALLRHSACKHCGRLPRHTLNCFRLLPASLGLQCLHLRQFHRRQRRFHPTCCSRNRQLFRLLTTKTVTHHSLRLAFPRRYWNPEITAIEKLRFGKQAWLGANSGP